MPQAIEQPPLLGQPAGMGQLGVEVQGPTLGHRRAQGLQVADDDGALVDMDGLDRQPRDAFGQSLLLREHPLADGRGIEAQQFVGRRGAVPHDELVLVGRVRRQRPDQRDAAALRPIHARDVQEGHALGLGAGDLIPHRLLAAQLQAEVPQLGLGVAQPAGQGHGGAHVGQRIVGRLVGQAIGGGQMLQLEARAAVLMLRPFEALGAQRIGAAHDVEQVPAAAAVLPFTAIGVDEVAPEQVARHLVVETDGVVAHADRARQGQHGLDGRRELMLGHAALQAVLRQDAGQQAALRVGQVVGCRLAVEHQRLADLVELGIGAQAGELGGPVAARHTAEGLVVVPEEGQVAHARTIPLSWAP
jgi:hypothetical protein